MRSTHLSQNSFEDITHVCGFIRRSRNICACLVYFTIMPSHKIRSRSGREIKRRAISRDLLQADRDRTAGCLVTIETPADVLSNSIFIIACRYMIRCTMIIS